MATKTSELVLTLKAVATGFKQGLSAARASFGHFVSALKTGFNAVKRAAKYVSIAIGLVATAITGAAIVAAKFEKNMAKVATQLDEPAKWMPKYKEAIKELAKETGLPLEDLADALDAILNADVPQENAMEVLRKSAKSAVASFNEVAPIAKAVTGVMNALGISFDQASVVVDIFHTALKDGRVEMDELAPIITNLAISARTAGVSLEEAVAAFIELTKKGMAPADAQMALGRAMSKLAAPMDSAKELAEKYGVSLGAAALETKGLIGVIKELHDKGVPFEDIRSMFPENVEKALLILLENSSELEKVLGRVYQSGGTQAKAYAEATNTLAFRWEKLKRTVEVFLIEAVTPLMPAITELFEFFIKVVQYIAGTLPGMKAGVGDAGMAIVGWIKSIILWVLRAHANVVNICSRVIAWFMMLGEKIRVVLDYGFFKWFFETIYSAVTQFFSNVGRIVWNFFGNLLHNIGEAATWIWNTLKSAVTGEEVPAPDWASLTEGCEWFWENAYPEAVQAGFEKVDEKYDRQLERLDELHRERLRGLKLLEEESFGKKGEEAPGEEFKPQAKLKYERRERPAAKPNPAEKAKEEAKLTEREWLEHQKRMGAITVQQELAVLRKMLAATKENTKERFELEEEIYNLEKQERRERLDAMFDEVEYSEGSEIQKLQVRIKALTEFMSAEKLSYEERKDMEKELHRLKRDLLRAETEDRKERMDKLRWETQKSADAYISTLKDRLRRVKEGSAEEANLKAALSQAENFKARRDWNWFQQNFARRKDLNASEMKDRILWLDEFAKSNALSEKEKNKVLSEAASMREKLKAKNAEMGIADDEIALKKTEELAKQAADKDAEIIREKESRIKSAADRIMESAQVAADSLKNAFISALDAVALKMQSLVSSLGAFAGRIKDLSLPVGKITPESLMPKPAVAGGNEFTTSVEQNITVNIGRGAFEGAKTGSHLDRKDTGEELGTTVAKAIGERLRPIGLGGLV